MLSLSERQLSKATQLWCSSQLSIFSCREDLCEILFYVDCLCGLLLYSTHSESPSILLSFSFRSPLRWRISDILQHQLSHTSCQSGNRKSKIRARTTKMDSELHYLWLVCYPLAFVSRLWLFLYSFFFLNNPFDLLIVLFTICFYLSDYIHLQRSFSASL